MVDYLWVSAPDTFSPISPTLWVNTSLSLRVVSLEPWEEPGRGFSTTLSKVTQPSAISLEKGGHLEGLSKKQLSNLPAFHYKTFFSSLVFLGPLPLCWQMTLRGLRTIFTKIPFLLPLTWGGKKVIVASLPSLSVDSEAVHGQMYPKHTEMGCSGLRSVCVWGSSPNLQQRPALLLPLGPYQPLENPPPTSHSRLSPFFP